MYKFDIITIGDANLDTILFIDEDEARLECNVKKHQYEICFDYGDKIPVKSLHVFPGGNAANTAVGFSRLGINTAIYTHLGEDDTAARLKTALKKEKISSKYISQKGKTNQSSILSVNGDRTIFSYHEKRNYKLPDLDSSKWIYLTSMKEGCEKVFNPLLDYINENQSLLAFNPGTYQIKKGIAYHQSLLRKTAILILNKEEAAAWLSMPVTTEIPHLLFELTKFGTKNAIITDGRAGSYGFDGINYYHCPIYPQKPLESTGAGDSYSAATVAAIFYGKPLNEAMFWGTVNAASAVSTIGSQEGLLKLSEIKHRLLTYKRVYAIPIAR